MVRTLGDGSGDVSVVCGDICGAALAVGRVFEVAYGRCGGA